MKARTVGIPAERKQGEQRVALLPAGVEALVSDGARVLVEKGAGVGAGAPDRAYETAGAAVVTRETLFADGDLICKVKEPLAEEWPLLNAGQVLFAYLHLAADPVLTQALMRAGITGIAFETVTGPDGRLPLLEPMSQIAGRLAAHMGAGDLMASAGLLLGGVSGVPPAKVVIVGAGTVGLAAAETALGYGARVVLLDLSDDRLASAARSLPGVETRNVSAVAEALDGAALVIGAAMRPGAPAPRVITRQMLKGIIPGGVVVDVAIDQGGCVETARATSHARPTYVVDGITHRCVPNLPGAVPRTASAALSAVLLPHVRALAVKGEAAAVLEDAGLAAGVNIWRGRLVQPAVAEAHGLTCTTLDAALDEVRGHPAPGARQEQAAQRRTI